MPNQSPAWHISNETFDGDFALDEVLAQKLATNVVSSKPEADLLSAYLSYTPGPDAGFGEQLKDATFSKNNVSGTLNATRQSAEAAIAQSKINSAAARITAGTAQSVKINSHMTLYNANKSGKGRPRLRVKVTRQPIKVFTPQFSDGAKLRSISRGGFSARGKDVKSIVELQGLTSKAHKLNGKMAGGILTFLPTVGFDFLESIDKDANGGTYINWRKFSNAEIRNQPGNALGFGAGLLVEAVAVFVGGAAVAGTAPVIVCALIAGITVQAIWNYNHGPDAIDNQRKKVIGE
ncbi:MAG: hypothetical protein H7246_23110 [Phycisphaerae bacterium]|nr:hypothetical protein [Saprospiraceae bacterium]